MPSPLNMRDEDRLPWLETVEPDHEEETPLGRIVALVVVGIALLAAIVFGIYKLTAPRGAADGQLIAAQPGDYKVRPDDPGGLKVEGEGDAAIATSAGNAGAGAIDLKAVPEAPVAGRAAPETRTPAAAATDARGTVASIPPSGGRLVAAAPMTPSHPPAAGSASGGMMVQLGAFPSEAAANSAWTSFSRRFAYLAALAKTVQPVATGSKTLYRLRVATGSADQAADVCGRLRVAGESCFVAS